MALTRISRLIVVFASSLAILGLMMASVDPEIQYSVDEIMDDPDQFQDSQIFVRGVVSEGSIDNAKTIFTLEGINGAILVDFSEAPIPDGFDEGRTIAVRGNLEKMDGSWVLNSFEIQTGCPSKYES